MRAPLVVAVGILNIHWNRLPLQIGLYLPQLLVDFNGGQGKGVAVLIAEKLYRPLGCGFTLILKWSCHNILL
jgi:hypothetical protein